MSLVIFSPCIFSGKRNFSRRKSILLITILLLHVVVDTFINVVKCCDFIFDNIVIPRGRNGTYFLPYNLEFLFPVRAFSYQLVDVHTTALYVGMLKLNLLFCRSTGAFYGRILLDLTQEKLY